MTATNDETTINLQNDITVNGKVFKAGQKVPVPKDQADDIARMDYEHQKYKDNLHVKNVYESNAGTIAVG